MIKFNQNQRLVDLNRKSSASGSPVYRKVANFIFPEVPNGNIS